MSIVLGGACRFDGRPPDDNELIDLMLPVGAAARVRQDRLGAMAVRIANLRSNSHLHCLVARNDRLLLSLLIPGDDEALSRAIADRVRNWRTCMECRDDLAYLMPGDFAFALWDDADQALHLGRPPLSQVSLFYIERDRSAAFSTLAPTLARKGSFCLDRLLDMRRRVAPILGSAHTGFNGVKAVTPGTTVIIDGQGARTAPFLALVADPGLDGGDMGDEPSRLRTLFTASIDRALAATSSPIMVQLSGGRDSGVVTAMAAARLRQSGRALQAMTYAPKEAFTGACSRYRYDESEEAAVVAQRAGNVVHRIIRPERFRLCENLDARHAFLPMPWGAPTNLHWWNAIEMDVARSDADCLFTGVCGNFTVSAGGPWALSDTLDEDGAMEWLRQISRCRHAPGSSIPSLLNMTFGGRIPRATYQFIQSVTGKNKRLASDAFLKGDAAAARRSDARHDDPRPPRSYRGRLLDALRTADFADQSGPMLHGVTQHDPTADRHIAQLMLNFPVRLLVSRHDRRTLFDTAFGDLLPQTVLRPHAKGSQGGDWNMVIDVDEIRLGLNRYADCRAVRDWIDIEALHGAIDWWPMVPVNETATELHFIADVLPTISLASFIYVHSDL